ncbi:MAG: hypothetical protein P8M27_03095 [Flavobacteriaceae bacterium]|nr:hypothetical protein [Flavobacteriaceae bacterium]
MIVSVLEIEVFPSDHSVNSYPSFGIAVIVTSVPSSYSPPSLDTLPPSPADTVNV